MRRSQSDQMNSEQGESPVRRFPRVGSQYQTRISKSTEPAPDSTRPKPDRMRMSIDFPYILEKEANQNESFDINGRSNLFGYTSALAQYFHCTIIERGFYLLEDAAPAARP